MVKIKFKVDSRAPVYVQVIEYFKEQIASGQLQMGAEIPSRREMAAKLKINPNTVQRAYKEMEEARLIITDGNKPSRVTTDEHVVKQVREELVQEALDTFVLVLKTLEIPLMEIMPRLEEKYKKVGSEGENT